MRRLASAHTPWAQSSSSISKGGWSTSLEAIYPRALCRRVVQLASSLLSTRPELEVDSGIPDVPRAIHSAAMRSFVGRTPRGRAVAALIPEFKFIRVYDLQMSAAWPKVSVPEGQGRALRVIRDVEEGVGALADPNVVYERAGIASTGSLSSKRVKAVVGIHYSP